jgi:hypothetical protein
MPQTVNIPNRVI